jgi:pyruvate,water dikinase
MTIHTRQLDMIMQDAAQVAARRGEMLAHCRSLFTGRALPVHVGARNAGAGTQP